jgi:hypothetical protein
MGKGTIISHTGEGLYSVTLNLDKTHLTAELTKLATDITNYGIAIPEITTQIATLEAELAALDPSSTEYKNKKKTYDAKVKIKNVFIINLAAAIKRQSFLNKNMPVDPTISAWCADLTTDLSGSVGTIEVPGERHTIVNIQPGFNNNAVYSQTRDGKLQPSLAGLENAVFYNYAILPGWQKWMPTYRYGTITAVSGDNCDVTLEAAVSSVTDKNGNGLDVNAVTTLSNVPIDYMDCDGEAFEVDDVVLIKFNSVEADIKNAGNWAHATVIGFKDHPKAPGGAVIYVQVYDLDWNIAGYVGLDKDLNVIEELKASITVPTPENVAAITRTSGNVGYSYWSKLWIAGNLMKEYAWQWAALTFTGTRDGMKDGYGVWSSVDVNCYFRADGEYKGSGQSAIQKSYVVINGVEHLLYSYDTDTQLGYFSNAQGYILLPTGEWDWQEGTGAFTVDGTLKYIGGRNFASYAQEGHFTANQEIFYYDGTTLVHKSFPCQDASDYVPFCTFGGVDYYIMDQGPVITLAV